MKDQISAAASGRRQDSDMLMATVITKAKKSGSRTSANVPIRSSSAPAYSVPTVTSAHSVVTAMATAVPVLAFDGIDIAIVPP